MKKHNHSSAHKGALDFRGRLGIVLLGVGVLAIVAAGYAYFGGSKELPIDKNVGVCPMLNTQNTSNQVQGGCGMMRGRSTNTSSQQQNTNTTQTNTVAPSNTNAEVINMTYTDAGLTPSVVNVTVGKSYTIVIKSDIDVYGCMSTINIPGLDDTMQVIKKGTTLTFHIAPTTAGEYEFLCAMGLPHHAKIVVQ